MSDERKKLVEKLRRLLEENPETFLGALVNTVDTATEGSEPALTKRNLQIERERIIVDYIARHF
jgi:hypothetical protein